MKKKLKKDMVQIERKTIFEAIQYLVYVIESTPNRKMVEDLVGLIERLNRKINTYEKTVLTGLLNYSKDLTEHKLEKVDNIIEVVKKSTLPREKKGEYK
jgi:hypothetical protein